MYNVITVEYNVLLREVSMSKKLTAEQIEEVVKIYKSGISAIKVAKMFNISPPSIYGLLKRRCIEIRTNSEASRKYTLDENYFDTLDTQEKAYFLGFLMADGYNNEKRGVIEVSCSEKDKEILEKLSGLIKSSKPIRFVESKGIKSYRIDLCSKRLSQKLVELGCMQNKTFKIKFPELKENLIRHFIRGYFDGDGCISYTYAKRDNVFKNSLNSVITIVSTEPFCLSLKQYIKDELQVNSTLLCRHPENNNNNRTLQVSGSSQVLKLMRWMYDSSTMYLNRKMEKFIDLQNKLCERKKSLCEIKEKRKDLIKLRDIAKGDVEYWNARYLVSHNLVSCQEKACFTPEQALALRKILDDAGSESAIPEEMVLKEFSSARKDGFPYYSFTDNYLQKRTISIANFSPSKENGLFIWDGFGTELANYFHPQMFECRKKGKISPLEFFNSDIDFKRGISKIVALYPKITKPNIREICCNETASSRINNFPPRVMASILKHLYGGKRITMLDPCSGFSGRLIGSYASGIVKKYIGMDLSEKTYDGLIKTKEFIDKVKTGEFEADIRKGSCLDILPTIKENIDFIFTSPPFLDEEEYMGVSVEKDYSVWKDVFIRPFIEKSYNALQSGSLFSVYTEAFRRNDFPLDFCNIAKEVGFNRLDDIGFRMSRRENSRKNSNFRVVKIVVFEKP